MADHHEDTSPDIYFEPIVKLEPVDVKNLEEDEEEIFKMRAKLYRYANEESPAEWKERGTGEIKLLRKREDREGKVRILMRRDKTFKICANHYVSTQMILKPNCGSDKAFVWNTLADFADEEPKPETLAIRFGNADNAKRFREKFEECQKLMQKGEKTDEKKDEKPENESKEAEKTKEADEVAEKLGGMTVNDTTKTEEDSGKEAKKTEEGKEEKVNEVKEEKAEESKAETSKEDSQGSGDTKDES